MSPRSLAPARVLSVEVTGYEDSSDYLSDRLAALRARLRAVCAHLEKTFTDPGAEMKLPSEVAALEHLIERRVRASGPDLVPISRVRDRLALTATEELVLWVLIATELCSSVRQTIRGLSTEQAADPTTDVLRRIVHGTRANELVWRELGELGALRRLNLIERSDAGVETPEHRRTWKVSRRILALAHGVLAAASELDGIATLEVPAVALSELEVEADVPGRIARAIEREAFVIVCGRAGHGRSSLLAAIARQRSLHPLMIDARAIAKDTDTARVQLRAIARELRLFDAIPLIRDLDALAAGPEASDRLAILEQELAGLVLATAPRPIPRRWQRTPTTIDLCPLTGARRAALWGRALPMASPDDTEVLSSTYPLAPSLIHATARTAIELCDGAQMTPEHIQAALRTVVDDRLAGLATRLEVTQTWEDLVLPDEQLTAIVEMLARVRERTRVYEDWGFGDKLGKGLGIAALFSGPPGTGKSMTAGLIARELSTEVYQVDVSKITSKWIGETEKNLAALFDAAEAGHAILLFDEADALFGKRTEVRSSNDRHANQEVNFLLQRLESYTGIVILTTNHDAAIDDAFRRRLALERRQALTGGSARAQG